MLRGILVLAAALGFLSLAALAQPPGTDKKVEPEKALPSSCKLTGKLDGDFLVFTAEFGFATLMPRTTVFLGLKGAHLTDEGSIDGQAPNLEYTEEGYFVRVDKEGPHRLVLNLRVAAPIKKTAGNTLERGSKFDLPGAAATLLALELPKSVDELSWNENQEKTRTAGRWEFGLGAVKSLSLNWKEPAPLAGNTPLAKAEGQIVARVDDTSVTLAAEVFLEDLRPFSKEWQLWLPGGAKITDVKGPNGMSREWKTPSDKSAYYRISDVSTGKWQVSISQRLPRPKPGTKLTLTPPFHVVGAFQNSGTITVQMPAEFSFGQRLAFKRLGNVEQIKATDTESVFQYVMPAGSEKTLKPVLELDWRTEKNQIETQVDHALKLKSVADGWEIEATTRIKATALFAAFNSIDIKLPAPRPRGLSMVGTVSPGLGFPGLVPWGGLLTLVRGEEVSVTDENSYPLKQVQQDNKGTLRVIAERVPSKQMTVLIKRTIQIPAQHQRIRLELPRPLNSIDRRAKLVIDTDERVELLHGTAGAEEPVPNRHHFELGWDQSPMQPVELAWRSFERSITAEAIVDVTLFEHSAMVKQVLKFPRDATPGNGVDPKHQQFRLAVPRGIDKVSILSGGEITSFDKNRHWAWLHPGADAQDAVQVVLQYDLALTKQPPSGEEAGSERWLSVTPIWPLHIAQKDVKVRVWASPSASPRLPSPAKHGAWKQRSVELVPGKSQFPSMVLQAYGTNLPLDLPIEESVSSPLAAFVADRALMEIRISDDDRQQCRARYWLRNVHRPYVEVELPLPLSRFHEQPTFWLGNKKLVPEKVDASERVIRLALTPELTELPAVLEIAYTIPAEGTERSAPWRTALNVPILRSDVVIAQTRWQVQMASPVLAVSLNRKARPDWQWSLHTWLLAPEPAVANTDLDAWLTGKDSVQAAEPLTYAFVLNSSQSETLYHLPRHWWLLLCSGVFLIVTLGAYYSPMSRLAFWLMLFVLGLASLVIGLVCPALLPPLVFGLQPGILLLIAFVGVHWLIQERYRRRLIFMPGFVRPQTGSTMVRTTAAKRPREASTIDAPSSGEGQSGIESPETPPA